MGSFSSEISDALTGVLDRGVDRVRTGFGLPPRPPEIIRLGFAGRPQVQTPAALQVQSRRAFVARIRCLQGDRVLYDGVAPLNGQVGITPLSLEPIQLRLELESRHGPTVRHGLVVAETIIEPATRGPEIEQIELSEKARLGAVVTFKWGSPAADQCWIACPGDIEERPVPIAGETTVCLARPGRHTFRVVAQNRFGRTLGSRTVDVVAPALRVTLPGGAARVGHPGDEVRFDWRIEGAREAWLIAPGRDAPQRVGFDHALIVMLGCEPEEFQLIARGYSDDEQCVTLKAIPRIHHGLD